MAEILIKLTPLFSDNSYMLFFVVVLFGVVTTALVMTRHLRKGVGR